VSEVGKTSYGEVRKISAGNGTVPISTWRGGDVRVPTSLLMCRDAVTSAEKFDCASTTTTAAHPGPAVAATAAASSPSLFVLGPAAFDPSDDDALSCPLVVNAAEGQHVNLTLYDFAATSHLDNVIDDLRGYDQVRLVSMETAALSNFSFISCFASGTGAKYCEQRVCMFV